MICCWNCLELKSSERGKPQSGEDFEQVGNNMDFEGELLMHLGELEGKGHVSSSWTGSDFDHYTKLITKYIMQDPRITNVIVSPSYTLQCVI